MRTTLTLDADVADLVQGRMHERGVSFKQAVNDGLRAGLQPHGRRRKYTVVPAHLGEPLIPLDHALRVAAALEDAALAEKMRQGR